MTYKVYLTVQEVTERNLDLPEELFDEDHDSYVLSYYMARKYAIFNEAELSIIHKECHMDSNETPINMKRAYPVKQQEVNDMLDQIIIQPGGHRILIDQPDAIIKMVVSSFKKDSRIFEESSIKRIVMHRAYTIQDNYRMNGTYNHQFRSKLD